MRQRDLCFYITGGFLGIGLALAYAQPAPDAAKLAPGECIDEDKRLPVDVRHDRPTVW